MFDKQLFKGYKSKNFNHSKGESLMIASYPDHEQEMVCQGQWKIFAIDIISRSVMVTRGFNQKNPTQ